MSAGSTRDPKRWRKFQPAANPETGLSLQARDLDILEAVARYRLIQTDQLLRLLSATLPEGMSQRSLQRRLTKLFRHGYLHRTPFIDRLTPGGSPLIHAITNRSARLLQAEDRLPVSMKRFDENNQRLAHSRFIPHTLLIAEFITALEAHCARSADVSFVSQQAITGTMDSTAKIVVHDAARREYRVVPDMTFGLCYHHLGDRTGYYYLEADRGTEDLRYSPNRPTIEGKLRAYYEAFRQGREAKAYPPLKLPNFRVLYLTNKPERQRQDRLEGIREMYQRVTGGQARNVFLFARHDSTPAALDAILTQTWVNGAGEPYKLDGSTITVNQANPTP